MAVINMRMPELEENNGPVQLTDSAPYLYRQAPIITEKLSDKLIGGTYAFNQLVENGNFSDATGWSAQEPSRSSLTIVNGVAQVTLTVTPASLARPALKIANDGEMLAVTGHVYFLAFDARCDGANVSELYVRSNAFGNTYVSGLSASWARFILVKKATSANPIVFYIGCGNAANLSVGESMFYRNLVIHDLTQMFGAAIADYLYNLETATPGAGVAWFRNLFPADYYAYNAGELISVKTSAHKMVGFNQFDPSASYTIGGNYRYIDVPYGKHAVMWITLKDKDTSVDATGCYLGFVSTKDNTPVAYVWTVSNGVVDNRDSRHQNVSVNGVTGVLCPYVFVYPQSIETFEKLIQRFEICVNISDPSKNGTYEPYEEHVYPLDNDLELRGIPKLDAENNLYYDGDVYESNGTVTRKYGIVDLGTLSWIYDAAVPRFYSTDINMVVKRPSNNLVIANVLANGYVTDTFEGLYSTRKTNLTAAVGNTGTLSVINTAYTNANAFKTAMAGVYLVYELADPTTESAVPVTDPQDAGYTEQYIDERAVPVPVGHETKYFDMIQNVVIPMALPMYDDDGGVVIPMALPPNVEE